MGLCSLNAAAAIITFNFTTVGMGTDEGSTLTRTSGGVTLTLTNPIGGTSPSFYTDSYGLYIYPDTATSFSFDLTLSADAKIIGYSISNASSMTSASFDLTGGRTGAASSVNNSLLNVGNFSLSSDYILNANQTGSFAATLTGDFKISDLFSLTIDTNVPADTSNNVPEPSALALFGLGLAGFRSFRRAKS